jgi:hypothetical protein
MNSADALRLAADYIEELEERLLIQKENAGRAMADFVAAANKDAADAVARIEALEKECFGLAANQCGHGYGDEHGHFRCLRIEALEAALRKITSQPNMIGNEKAKAIASAALAPEQGK